MLGNVHTGKSSGAFCSFSLKRQNTLERDMLTKQESECIRHKESDKVCVRIFPSEGMKH
jgi:hypothetical protein